MKHLHELIKIDFLKLIYPHSQEALFCWKKKEAYHDPIGMSFCPACGLNLNQLCKPKLTLRNFSTVSKNE